MLKFKPDPIGSYSKEDVIFLLRDLSKYSIEVNTEEREKLIQSGVHYSEMLPVEFRPNEEYMELYKQLLQKYSGEIAQYTATVSEQIIQKKPLQQLVLVSLARAGTPIGILMKRYLDKAYQCNVPHYAISIIRGKGIDETAIEYIFEQHPDAIVQFVDGWTGKGAIKRELSEAINKLRKPLRMLGQLDDSIAVLSDPAYCAEYYGTREDFLVPSACLNSTVSGLVSRTVLNFDLQQKNDFHGAKYYKELMPFDVSNDYIQTICKHFTAEFIQFNTSTNQLAEPITWAGIQCVDAIKETYEIKNIHHIKPGIGETTRVLLRRVPWKILINPKYDADLQHIYHLAKERNVTVEEYTNMTYACCGIIKELQV